MLGSRLELEAIAQEIEKAERHWRPVGTGLAAAVEFSVALLESLPIMASRRVIGGPDSFVMPAKDTRSFRDTMMRKLLREVGRWIS